MSLEDGWYIKSLLKIKVKLRQDEYGNHYDSNGRPYIPASAHYEYEADEYGILGIE